MPGTATLRSYLMNSSLRSYRRQRLCSGLELLFLKQEFSVLHAQDEIMGGGGFLDVRGVLGEPV